MLSEVSFPALWTLSSLLPCPAHWPQGHETQVVPESGYTRRRCSARGWGGGRCLSSQGRRPALAVSSFPKQTRGFASSHSGQSTVGLAVFSRSRGVNSTARVRSRGSLGCGGVTVDQVQPQRTPEQQLWKAGARGAWVGEAQLCQPATTPGSTLAHLLGASLPLGSPSPPGTGVVINFHYQAVSEKNQAGSALEAHRSLGLSPGVHPSQERGQ